MEHFAAGEFGEGSDFFLVALFVELETFVASGVVEVNAEGAGELADLEVVFAGGFGIGLVGSAQEEFEEPGADEDGASLSGVTGVAEVFGHLAGHFVAGTLVGDLFLAMEPFLVAVGFPVGDVLVTDARMAKGGEALGNGVKWDGVGDPLVDGIAEVGGEAGDFAVG